MRWPYAGMLFSADRVVGICGDCRNALPDSGRGGFWLRADSSEIPLDAASSLSWATAIAVLLIGGFGFEVWRRKFKKCGTTARNVLPRPSRRQRRPSYEPE
jgi:hypothetical protein